MLSSIGCGDNAVVSGGTITHWNGSAWSLSWQSGGADSRYLSSVWGSGPHDIWAVGLGVVLHGDGSSWTTVLRRDDENALRTGWGSGPRDVWVGGGVED